MEHKNTNRNWKDKLRPWLRALTNPHLLISIAIAWMITNGWAYCAVGIGWYLDIPVLLRIGSVWLGLLWVPGTPEKLLTFGIAMGLLRVLFPDDTRTLAMVRSKWKKLMAQTKQKWQKFREKRAAKRSRKQPPDEQDEQEPKESR